MGPVELGTASFGQGPAVTALQQVAAVSAVVNGGTLYVPQIVKEIRDANGALVGEVNPVVAGSPISKETSDRLRILLEGAITSGSGKSAYIEGYRVGGKTGTAQIPNPEGGYYPDRYIASFIGAVPIDDPKIVLLVMVNDPKGKYGYYGSMVAAPAFKAMVTDILPYIGIQPKFNSSGLKQPTVALVPELRGLSSTAALSHLRDAGLILKIEGIGITVLQQSPAAGSSALLGATVVVTLGENSDPTDKVSVGNVIGLSMKDASIRLSSLGLKIIIEGSGFAISQSPIGGSIVERGTAIRVNFKP
ncbi:MAG: penicillin-binding transpeptidase domain-containing protein [bacterium]|nr:penicillin-binding transpeptidase domain-containing protein [bacterium]